LVCCSAAAAAADVVVLCHSPLVMVALHMVVVW
jgi:hypothetical protein